MTRIQFLATFLAPFLPFNGDTEKSELVYAVDFVEEEGIHVPYHSDLERFVIHLNDTGHAKWIPVEFIDDDITTHYNWSWYDNKQNGLWWPVIYKDFELQYVAGDIAELLGVNHDTIIYRTRFVFTGPDGKTFSQNVETWSNTQEQRDLDRLSIINKLRQNILEHYVPELREESFLPFKGETYNFVS